MRRSVSSALGLALVVSSSLATPTQAVAAPKDYPFDLIDLCEFFVSEGYAQTVGECVSGFRANPTRTCQSLKSGGYLEASGFRNLGDCVRTLRDRDDD